MDLECIPPQHVVVAWPKVEKFLAEAFTHSAGEYSLEQLRAFLSNGTQTLLVFVEDNEIQGALTMAAESYPNFSVGFITAIGGKCIASHDNADKLAAWCRGQGFTHIRGAAFEAVARLWRRVGFQEIYRIVELKL